jgi:hypothetical protein
MNERIRELAEQATKKYDRLGNEIPFAQPDLEKFAELIIRECAQDFDNTYMRGGKTMGAYIREKFGVES